MSSGIFGGINLSGKVLDLISINFKDVKIYTMSKTVFVKVNAESIANKIYCASNNFVMLTFEGKIYNCEHEKFFDINNLTLNYNLNKIYGKFAIAVADNNGNISLTRDYPGLVPMFYCLQNDVFVFSTIYGLLETLKFKKVQIVPPGKKVFYENRKLLTVSWYQQSLKKLSNSNLIEHLDNLFDTVVSEIIKFHKNFRFGIMLSGGVDSALLSYYISKHLPSSNIYSYTIDGEDRNYGEQVSKIFGFKFNLIDNYLIKKEKILFSSYDYNKQFDNLNNSLFIPVYLIAKKAKKDGVNLLFSGDGVDEIFGGYDMNCDKKSVNIAIKKMLDNMFLYSLDRLSSACNINNIDIAVPFLHQKIIEVALSVDSEYKKDKFLIRKIAEKHLPQNIVWRKKTPLQVSTQSYELLYNKKWVGLHH